jgi:hypothetical protein
MKIGVISNLFPPKVCGGYEIGCGQVVEGLRERGENVQVLTSASCLKEDRDYVWNTLCCSMGVGFSKMSRLAKLRYLFGMNAQIYGLSNPSFKLFSRMSCIFGI